jgi:hypothetical protein
MLPMIDKHIMFAKKEEEDKGKYKKGTTSNKT